LEITAASRPQPFFYSREYQAPVYAAPHVVRCCTFFRTPHPSGRPIAPRVPTSPNGFAGEVAEAVRRHLGFSLQSICDSGRGWVTAAELIPWVEARSELMNNADAVLPEE
jgi:hypothetical protein